MSSAGPSGVAALPPDWLADIALPLTELAAGTILVRIHRTANPPVFFSPGRARRPAGRFDSAAGAFGIVSLLSRAGVEADQLEDYRGLNARNPWLAFMLLLLMFSMAGVPPTPGDSSFQAYGPATTAMACTLAPWASTRSIMSRLAAW